MPHTFLLANSVGCRVLLGVLTTASTCGVLVGGPETIGVAGATAVAELVLEGGRMLVQL